MSDDDFSNHPVSIAEIVSNKTNDARLWTPRDALISCLRDLDSGKINPSQLIISYEAVLDNDGFEVSSYVATKGTAQSVALLEFAKFQFLRN